MILENKHLLVEVEERGAQLMRVYSRAYDHDYIWINDPHVWEWRSPVLFPIVGELKDGRYHYNGKWFEMGRHGIVRDALFTGKAQDMTLHFTKLYDESSLARYPFKFEFQVMYKLAGSSVECWFHVHNRDENTMPFSVGGHPAFSTAPRSDYFIQFETGETAPSDGLTGEGLRSGEMRTGIVNGKIALEPDLFDNDALIFKDLKSRWCELRSHSSARLVRLHFEQFPYLGIWSKPNAPYVCIEPWYGVADRFDASGNFLEKEGIALLPPESMLRIGYRIDFL